MPVHTAKLSPPTAIPRKQGNGVMGSVSSLGCSHARWMAAGMVLLGIALLTGPLHSAPALIPVGTAAVDITPSEPIRLSGYGGRTSSSAGVEQSLWAKALAFGSPTDGSLAVLLTVDNTGVPAWMTEKVFGQLEAKTGLNRPNFALCSSHTHTGPMLRGVLPNLFAVPLTPEEVRVMDRYSDHLADLLVSVVLKAVDRRVPAEIGWEVGRADFAANRRTPRGPVDHDMPLLAIKGTNGQWLAFLANYACHCTTLGGDFNRHCGDWAGYAQQYLQERFPNAVALVAIGCGGDIDPLPRTKLSMAQDHGREIATEVQRLLQTPLRPVTSLPHGKLERFDLMFDTALTVDEWKSRASKGGIVGYHARLNLDRLAGGEALPKELPYSVQTWAFGSDLAMVFLPGEVVVDYALRLKSEYQHDRLWVNAYANDVPCYIPSARIWKEGGYEGGAAMPYYDRPTRLAQDTEQRIFSHLQNVIPATFRETNDRPSQSPALSPANALKAFRVKPGFEVELVASEPLIVDPVAIDFGADGRLWVVEMRDYPMGIDGNYSAGGHLKVLSDRDGDGRFEHAETLLDDLPFPTGVTAWKKGALVCAAPDILYVEDTDGDGRADVTRKLFSGFATHNFQARVNSLHWGLDGWVYGAAGLFGGTIHSHINGKNYALSGRDFRIRPDTGEFETVSGLSQQSRVRDDFGNAFGCDNGSWMWHFTFTEHYLKRNPSLRVGETRVYVPTDPRANDLYPSSRTAERFNDFSQVNRTTSACGLEVFRSLSWGTEWYGNAYICEPVHNLVRRFQIQPNGGTFSGVKAADEAHVEFLSSTDNWFRPVEVRTGPDDALWVTDMYRFIVEHPRWIPAERLATLNPRAGDQQGRLYRVKPAGAKSPATWPDLTRESTPALARRFGSGNGVIRDLVHHLLIERNDLSVAPIIRSWVGAAHPDGVRVQALYLLDQWRALDDALLVEALDAKSPWVRKSALQLAESRDLKTGAVIEKILRMTDDPSPEVRFQLALSLGEWRTQEAGVALGRLAARDMGDPRLRIAILSSASRYSPEVLAATLRVPEKTQGRDAWIEALINTASTSEDEESKAAVFAQVLPRLTEPVTVAHLDVMAAFGSGAARMSPDSELAQRAGRVLDYARLTATNAEAELKSRRSAVVLMGVGALPESDVSILGTFFEPGALAALQDVALQGLKHSRQPAVAGLLLQSWGTQGPATRRAILEVLVSRDEWCLTLLSAIQRGSVSAGELSHIHRQRLLRHSHAEVARRSAEVFTSSPRDQSHQERIKAYEATNTHAGDLSRGFSLFLANCTACHAFRGNGNAVGPDLSTYQNKPLSDFLLAILDPNSVVEPRFINYLIETRDERSLSGIVQDETPNSLTLVLPGGGKESLLRSDILSLKASRDSLMPEGFESALNPQAMVDLVAYLKSGQPSAFGASSPSSSEAARREFLASLTPSFQIVTFSSDVLDYPCWLGKLPMRFCRQSDGKGSVQWATAPVSPSALTNDWLSFQFPVGMGFLSSPAGTFTFLVNDQKAFDFSVSLGDASWESRSLPVRCRYQVMERGPEDSNGRWTLEIRSDVLKAGQPVRIAVAGSRSSSMRWFGLYSLGGSDPGQGVSHPEVSPRAYVR